MDFSNLKYDPKEDKLTWYNVLYSVGFIIFPIALSAIMGLNLSFDLIVSGLRCIIQLSLMGSVLQNVLNTKNPFLVLALSLLLTLLASFELVYSKTKKQFKFMFPFVLLSLISSCIGISIIGTLFAVRIEPFWQPDQFIPLFGMLIGNAMSAVAVGINTCMKELSENSNCIEQYLSMGATRTEATKPILIHSLRLSLLPTINAMSIIGLISIPGMMTGQILGGSSVGDAVKYQQIIMFMITSSSTIAVLFSLFFLIYTVLDKKHRLRNDRILIPNPWFSFRTKGTLIRLSWALTWPFRCIYSIIQSWYAYAYLNSQNQEIRQPLLGQR